METILCPLCQKEMKPGRAAVIKNLAAKIQWPFHSDRLFFKPADENQKSEIFMREGKSFVSYKCDDCEVLLVTKERYSSLHQN